MKRLAGRSSPAREARTQSKINALLDELGALLITPALSHVAAAARLIVIPYGSLHGLPFHALRHKGEFLVEHFDVSLASSLVALAKARSPRLVPPLQCTLVAARDDKLPAIDEEARALKAIYGEALRELDAPTLGPALTRGDVTGSLLHIAAHGAFQPHNPMFSGLSFGSCVLTAHDISSLALNLEVVTLGGCETGRSGRIEGEALLGIDQAFLGAGARAVLSSLWVVDDQVAGELMARTHGELAKGRTIGAALATAQRAALKRDPHPFQWAPFTLSGDPDARILNSGPTHLDQ